MKKNGLFFTYSLMIFLSGFLFSARATEMPATPGVQLNKLEGPDLVVDSYRTMDGQQEHNFGTITVKDGGNLRFLDTYGNVSLNCQKLVVAGGVVTIDATSGIYINCGEIEVLAGSIYAPAAGLNLTCRGITNYGQIYFGTSNYIYVNGNIVNGAGISYRGNGFVFAGDKIEQTNDTADFNVSYITNSVTDRILYLGGNIQFNQTAFNIGRRTVKNMSTSPVQLNFDGGYLLLADGSMDSINIDGKNGFYISDGLYTHSKWTGVVELSGWNTNIGDGSTVEATVVPKEYFHPVNNAGDPLGADNHLFTSGNVIFRGEIKDTLQLKLDMRVYNTLSNFGVIRTRMDVFGGGSVKNYGKIFNEITLKEENLYLDLPLGNKTMVNAGEITGRVNFGTDYLVNSENGSGYWEGYVHSDNQFKKAVFSGKHIFNNSTIAHLNFNNQTVLTVHRSSLLYLKGDNTFIQQKSANEYQYLDGFEIYGAGKMTFLGNNNCNVIARDTLCFKKLQSGWDVQYPAITGKVENYGPVIWNSSFDLFTINGEWINNGSVLNQCYVNGVFVNNGTVDAQINSNGHVFSNGKWPNSYDKMLYMKFTEGTKYLWLVNDGTVSTPVNLTAIENSYSNTWYKNGVPFSFGGRFTSVSKSDTAVYDAKSSTGAWSGKLDVTVKNPYQFTQPAESPVIPLQQVDFKWNRIPGATAYKVRISYISDKNNQEYDFYTDTIATDTTLTVSGMGLFMYKAYLSARFGFEGNYTWSQESYPFLYENGKISSVEGNEKPELKVFPSSVKTGELITISGLDAGYNRIICTDLSGRELKLLYEGLTDGQLLINTSGINAGGLYLIRVIHDENQKIFLLTIY